MMAASKFNGFWRPLTPVLAVPIISRIHEGLGWSNRDKRTLLDHMAESFINTCGGHDTAILLVLDAYYSSARLIRTLLDNGHQVITRVKRNTVACYPAKPSANRRRGRPKVYGPKIKLMNLFLDESAFTDVPSPVYGERNTTIKYLCLDLL